MLTGLALGIGGWFLGAWIGGQMAVGHPCLQGTDQNDVGFYMAFLFVVIGWLVVHGFANVSIGGMLGRPPSLRHRETGSWTRYFRLCTDHKVVGIQYLFGVGISFFIGGLNAMLMRTELLRPVEQAWPAGQELTLLSLHGTMMIMMTSAVILGPFGNYFVPIMIGARRMAFPRIEALTFWLVPAAGLILLSAIAFGGIATGWTGYAPVADEGRAGMDAYVMAFILIAISLTLVGINLLATILTMRAPGMSWTRLPIFVWSVLATSILMALAAPVLVASMTMVLMDRAANTSFFVASV